MEPVIASEVRLDKWLWAVRIYRTRTLAAAACRAGHVRVAGQPAKPAREVHLNEIITAKTGPVTRTVKVIGLVYQRVGANLVSRFLEDHTPPEEFKKREEARLEPVFHRPKGSGRPTKRDRRLLTRARREGERDA